jgi:oligopeptide/dipeptide ABC transporter ATP-binding protein
MVFQEASEAFNPVFTIGFQLAEAVRAHRSCSRAEAREAARGLLDRVALEGGDGLLGCYPHQLSGGQLQRTAIAIALAGEPRLLVADEPTSALDLVTQARILDLLRRLTEHDVSLLLISHDLAVVGGLVERVVVMLAGRVVEEAPSGELFAKPLHPYTRMLLAAAPEFGPREGRAAVAGARPTSFAGQGCVFAGQCPTAQPQCRVDEPPLTELGGGRRLRCPVVLEAGDG